MVVSRIDVGLAAVGLRPLEVLRDEVRSFDQRSATCTGIFNFKLSVG